MFGFNKRIYERQLKRAIIINNAVMMGLFNHQMDLLGYKPDEINEPDDKIRIIAAAIGYIFGKNFDESIKKFTNKEEAKKLVYSKADEILKSDSDLEKLIHRILLDIGSLCIKLKDKECAQKIWAEYPRLMEMMTEGKNKYPENFKDYNENEFKELALKYADKYYPEMKSHFLKLF